MHLDGRVIRRAVVNPRLPALALLLGASLSAPACKKDEEKRDGAHSTVAEDPGEKALARWTNDELVDRARRSHDCGLYEAAQCDDLHILPIRCELAVRAAKDAELRKRLLADARSNDKKTREASLRIVTFLADDASVKVVHDALFQADKASACRVPAYGVHFKREDAPRLAELEKLCEDGKPVIAVTREKVEQGKPGETVAAGSTCEELRAE